MALADADIKLRKLGMQIQQLIEDSGLQVTACLLDVSMKTETPLAKLIGCVDDYEMMPVRFRLEIVPK